MPDSPQIIEYIGFLAAAITGIALIPQALQIWKSGNFLCISVFVYSLFAAGAATWLLYGILIYKWPLILSNSMSLILAGSILILKIRSLTKS
ncbi:SemiSWEET transporter [Polynucleobacter sp. AP-RePozz3-80-G7]|uniref:SemiSWEET transporter n=1 Tax=Polynucleobacter sp. AP-RePozz3-80-G7 TaxID=2689105 RepID=UPI001C0C3DA6|nr:SemiSWEET transporter [Polynucleobacter sp. AP-RePozz3-80-G7]MBU3639819.1 SemiSWEET transporter [Polynucleobacter sp. AP-RePozz3-80-G7]